MFFGKTEKLSRHLAHLGDWSASAIKRFLLHFAKVKSFASSFRFAPGRSIAWI